MAVEDHRMRRGDHLLDRRVEVLGLGAAQADRV